MSNRREKIAYHYKNSGLLGLFRKIIEYASHIIWSQERWLIYERTLDGENSSQSATIERRELGLNELVDLGYFKARDYHQVIKSRIESGNICHGFFAQESLVTIGWSSPDYLELDTDFRISCPGSVGLYDFVTCSEFRSKGYYTSALVQLLNVMRQRGYEKALIAVAPNNTPSIKGIERAGFQQAVVFMRFRRFGAQKIGREEKAANSL